MLLHKRETEQNEVEIDHDLLEDVLSSSDEN